MGYCGSPRVLERISLRTCKLAKVTAFDSGHEDGTNVVQMCPVHTDEIEVKKPTFDLKRNDVARSRYNTAPHAENAFIIHHLT